MSAEPAWVRAAIETLREGYEAWNRRDFETLAGMLAVNDLEFVRLQAFTSTDEARAALLS